MFDMYNKEKFHYQSDEIVKEYRVLNDIYSKMADDESKALFTDRILFSIMDDWRFVKDLLNDSGVRVEIDNKLNSLSNKEMYIYGAGISGCRIPILYNEYNWKGYIDKKKAGDVCNGLPVYGIEICSQRPDEKMLLVTNLKDTENIKCDLEREGISEENIVIFADYIRKTASKIYFDDFMDLQEVKDKIFVDCGAYNGEDTINFISKVSNNNAYAFVFEADESNYKLTLRNLSKYHNVKVINKGISNSTDEYSFDSEKGEMSSFSEEGDNTVKMTTLDSELVNYEVGYIKMDIEGLEKEALAGAVNIISKQKPILAISIYHKREDIWEIPSMLLEINPEYKFYMRHYSLSTVDTVLYAV